MALSYRYRFQEQAAQTLSHRLPEQFVPQHKQSCYHSAGMPVTHSYERVHRYATCTREEQQKQGAAKQKIAEVTVAA